ncbi:MAG: nicotinate (nicotinamide) nucleotide adenylyltransferase [Rikenellaceae bacterium]|nr:nicotinate (nicotinamide) nucleotide adenylyltransferase [Rikenellaceae bacterium]
MPEVIIYPGSFNPVHNGHTAVAGFVADSGLCDELWMLVSPQNPLKKNSELAPERDRLEMARIAAGGKISARNVIVSDAEMSLPTPNYTVETLRSLGEQYPGTKFSLLVGSDILPQLHRWRDFQFLLDNYRIYVYPRQGAEFEKMAPGMTFLSNAPKIEISSTAIRRALENGDDLTGMLSRGVVNYIYDKGLWVADGARRRLERLNKELEMGGTVSAGKYLERGKLNYKFTRYEKALNDFIRASELDPDNREAKEYIKLLDDIFEYRYTDLYNP